MLDLSINGILRNNKLTQIVCIASFICSPLAALQYQDGADRKTKNCEQEWLRYFDSIDENTPLEEVIDFLFNFKRFLEAEGYEVPSLTEICINCRNALIERGIEIDDDQIEEIYIEFYNRENDTEYKSYHRAVNKSNDYKIIQVKKHKGKDKKKDKKDAKVSGKMAFGFLKFIAGGLCCIIPVPIVQGMGAVLAGQGINEMVDCAREEGDKNEQEKKRNNSIEM